MALVADPVSAVLSIGEKLINRLWPDPVQAASAKLELIKLERDGELQQIIAQLKVNEAEAGSNSIWVAGWRPFIGWICGVSFAYKFVLSPFIALVLQIMGRPIILPVLDYTEMSTILFAMLGIGGLRTYEKIKGANAQ